MTERQKTLAVALLLEDVETTLSGLRDGLYDDQAQRYEWLAGDTDVMERENREALKRIRETLATL